MKQNTTNRLQQARRTARPRLAQALHETRRLLIMTIGAAIAAFGYATFQVPHNIVAGGLSGISIIINHYTGWPVGLLFWLMNIPMLVLGFRYLGRWQFLLKTLLAATLFSVATDLLIAYLPTILHPYPLTSDPLLNTIYGGLVGGIGGGLIYRAGGTIGGTGVIGRIVQRKTGLPLSQSYLFTDGIIIFAAGMVFGWEISMYGLLMLLLNGMASDYTLEGVSSTRVATIITDNPHEMTSALSASLGRGASYWAVTGGYTGEPRYMVSCTIYRSQVNDLKWTAAQVDPQAFITIGVSHQALGEGFVPLPQHQS